MSDTITATSTRPLGEALRNVGQLPAADQQTRFAQRFDWRNDAVHLRFTFDRQTKPGAWVHGVMGDKTLCVRVQHDQEQRIGERSWSDYEGEARLMAWTMVNDELITTLGQIFDGPFTPISMVSSPQLAAAELTGPALAFEVITEEGTVRFAGTLALSEETCDALVDQATPSPLPQAPTRWPALPLPIALRCDGPVMIAAALQDCAHGDMIVLGDRARIHERMAAFGTDGRRLPVLCQTAQDGVRIVLDKQASATKEFSNKETLTMSQTPPSPDDDASLASQIPVRLSIQTASVDISLAELEKMESGMVVPLEAPVAGTNVTILANGAAIGDGELVAAGDKLAVCIRRWRPDGL